MTANKKEPELSSYRHFYLYAKGWYQESASKIVDIRRLIANRCGLDFKHVNHRDIRNILLTLVYRHIDSELAFIEFFERMQPTDCWKTGYVTKDSLVDSDVEYDPFVAFVYACLGVLSRVSVKTLEGELILNLGEPDESVLPLKKGGKENEKRYFLATRKRLDDNCHS